MDSVHREKFISLLKDSVLTLCKNGLMDEHHGITRVEGLLGITMQNKEVFLINIREELLPPFASSCGAKKSQSSPGNKTHFKLPLKPATAATENRCKGSCFSTTGDRQSRTSSLPSEVTFAEVTVCCDDKENSLGNDPRLRVAGNQFGKDEIQSRDELSAMTIDSGDDDDDDTPVIDFSEPVVRPRRMKDEPDSLVRNVDTPPSNQRKNSNSDGTLVYQSTTESESLFIWPNDPKAASLSGVPCGYLPLALGYSGHRSGFDDPSPPSSALPFPGLLPMFYDGTESVPQAPSFSPCRTNLRPGAARQLKKYCCDICSYRSNRSYNLLRHVMHVHAIGSGPCADCGIAFNHKMQLRAHRIAVHGDRDGMGISMDAGNSVNVVKTEPEETVNS